MDYAESLATTQQHVKWYNGDIYNEVVLHVLVMNYVDKGKKLDQGRFKCNIDAFFQQNLI
jgi:hypothetical protein